MPCSTRIRLLAWALRLTPCAAATAGKTGSWWLRRPGRGMSTAPVDCALEL